MKKLIITIAIASMMTMTNCSSPNNSPVAPNTDDTSTDVPNTINPNENTTTELINENDITYNDTSYTDTINNNKTYEINSIYDNESNSTTITINNDNNTNIFKHSFYNNVTLIKTKYDLTKNEYIVIINNLYINDNDTGTRITTYFLTDSLTTYTSKINVTIDKMNYHSFYNKNNLLTNYTIKNNSTVTTDINYSYDSLYNNNTITIIEDYSQLYINYYTNGTISEATDTNTATNITIIISKEDATKKLKELEIKMIN